MLKKYTILLFALSLLACQNARSQWWIDVGAKGAINSTWLINGNYNKDKNAAYALSLGYSGGGKLGFNFNEDHEITLDILYSQVNQKYKTTGLDLPAPWERNVSLTYLEFPLLYRNNKNGTYIEIGPQYSMLMGASDNTIPGDAKEYFNKSNIAAVFGFGSYLFGTDNFYVCLGMRFSYGFLDIVSDKGGKGQDYHFLDPNKTQVDKYSPTNALAGGFILEFNYDLGYIVRSTCNKRRVLFF